MASTSVEDIKSRLYIIIILKPMEYDLPEGYFDAIMDMSFDSFDVGVRGVIPEKAKTEPARIRRARPPINTHYWVAT